MEWWSKSRWSKLPWREIVLLPPPPPPAASISLFPPPPHPLSSIVIVNHYYYYYDIEIFSSFSLSPVRRVRVALFYVNRSVRLTDLLYRFTFVGLWLYHALKWSVTQVFYFLGVIKVLKFIWFVVSLVGARGESKYRSVGKIVGEFFFSLSITGVE